MAASMWVVARCALRNVSIFKHDKVKRKCMMVGSCIRTCSNQNKSTEAPPSPSIYGDKDPAPLFFDERMQELLLRITGTEMTKIYGTMKMKISAPKYQFVTDDELKKLLENAKLKAKKKLQMPPVVKERVPINEVLSFDPEIQGFENHTILFTDITFGIPDRKRVIVARDPDGTLRQASWEERERANQIYFPRKGKDLHAAKLFRDEYLQGLVNRQEYEFVLDKACMQFEPDDPEYIKVTKLVYEDIDKNSAFESLRSTRHFGPMAFYLAFFRKIDNLLVYMIESESLNDAVNMIQIYHHIHPNCKSASQGLSPQEPLQFIRAFVENESVKRNNLEMVILSYEELQQQKQEHEDRLKMHAPSSD